LTGVDVVEDIGFMKYSIPNIFEFDKLAIPLEVSPFSHKPFGVGCTTIGGRIIAVPKSSGVRFLAEYVDASNELPDRGGI